MLIVRRLAGAVRADQPDELALHDREVQIVHGDDAAEAFAEVARLDQRWECGMGERCRKVHREHREPWKATEEEFGASR